MTIKISALGLLDAEHSTGKTLSVEARFNTNADDFADDLGKALFSVESMGLPFVTAVVYEDAIKRYADIKDLLKAKRYTTLFDKEGLQVSVIK